MKTYLLGGALLLIPALGWAQAQTQPNPPPPPPPPIVNAPDAPTQAVPPAPPPDQAPTPPPPGYTPPPPPSSMPGLTPGYQSYYGQPYGMALPGGKPPAPEIGLMISEGAFGILASGAETLLSYFLLLKPALEGPSGGFGIDPGVAQWLLVAILASTPLVVSQTELGFANSSRYYYSDSWPAALGGLGAEAAVVGLYFLEIGNQTVKIDGTSEAIILIGTVVVMPIVEMAVINMTKNPRFKVADRGVHYNADKGWAFSAPIPMPMLDPTPKGISAGLTLPLLSGRF